MEKQKLTLPTGKWGTLKTKYRPESNYVTNDEFTAGSQNFITNNTGAIEKRPTDVQYNTSTFSNAPKDQYEAVFSSGVHHLLVLDGGTLKYSAGNGIFTSVASGFTVSASMEYTMYQNRVYMDNGIDTPMIYDITPSYGGVTYSVPQVKPMGAQPPVSAPSFSSDTSGGDVPLGGHFYVITYLYYGDEESNGGPLSSLHTVSGPNQTVNLTAIPVGGYGVTARNIYRDNDDGNFLLVGTLEDNTTTIFTDTVGAGTTPIPTSNDLPPVFSYITTNLSRNWVGGVPGTPSVLYWSLPDLPDLFDPNNFSVCNPKDPITAVYSFQSTTIVLNRHSFGKILGTTDDTFYYDEVPGSVGCVDNRSIQIRTLDGVPVLIWLSDRGFYKFDGSSVTYISDAIEDIVNFNLQQVSFTTGSNNQSTEADYAGGTKSPSIDITSNPGVITVVNPMVEYQSESDWEGGSSLSNIATADGSNELKIPTYFTPTLSQGTLGGSTVNTGTTLVLPTTTGWSGDTTGVNGIDNGPYLFSKTAVSFIPPRTGTITGTPNITFLVGGSNNAGSPVSPGGGGFRIYTDSFGTPGADIGTVGITLTGGTKYWIVGVMPAGDTGGGQWTKGAHFMTGQSNNGMYLNGTFWVAAPTPIFAEYQFVPMPIASSGTWTSPIFDSFSINSAIANHITNHGTYPTNCSATIFVDMSNDSTMNTGITTFSQANPNGSYGPGLSGNRYWRIRYELETTDNQNTPVVDSPVLDFSNIGTWTSQPIDCTTDVTSYNAFQFTAPAPMGTSVDIKIATSADNITYSSYTTVVSAVVQRYAKIRIILTGTSDDASTPSVSFLQFSWNQTSTFTSSIIDVGQVPTGWGVFQDQSALNGGTLSFFMRSASSSGAIPSATFYSVSNGVFPPSTVLPLEFTQWKIVFTSGPDTLPEVSGVTINWFIGSGQSPIRAASLFFNKTYYFSGATIGSTTNNIVIIWDFENLWRIFMGVTIDALGLFFNEPFYCDGVRDNIYQWLIPPTGSGSAIAMDVRTKAYDLGNINVLKNIRSLRVTGINTGTTIHTYYSVDRGTTWIEMLNVSGNIGYTTSTNGNKFSQYFVADYSDDTVATSGSTIMYRVTSSDAYPCTIMELEPVLYVRSGKYLEIET